MSGCRPTALSAKFALVVYSPSKAHHRLAFLVCVVFPCIQISIVLLCALCGSQRCVHCHATAAVYRACSCLQVLQDLSFVLGYIASIAVSVRTSFQIVTSVYSSRFHKLTCLLTINILSSFCINCLCLPPHVFYSLQFCSLRVRL